MNDPLDCAQRWYGKHQAQYLARDTDVMVDACARHLMETHDISRRGAEHTAVHALGAASRADSWVDLDRSHAGAVRVVDAKRNTHHTFTACELLALARQRTELGDSPNAPSG